MWGVFQERERWKNRNKKRFTDLQVLSGDKGRKERIEWEGDQNQSRGGKTILVGKESLSFIEMTIKGRMDGCMEMWINFGTRMINF